MAVQRQTRHVGDTEVAIAATLKRPDGTVVDLTGLTLKFKMLDSEGSTKVALTDDYVTVTDEDAGQVQYSPVAADVDTAGTYYAYFVTVDGTANLDTFPAEKGEFRIDIKADV